jgi:hypothetical protein
MAWRRLWVGWVGVAAGVLCLCPGTVRTEGQGWQAGEATRRTSWSPEAAPTLRTSLFGSRSTAHQSAAASVPLEELPPRLRGSVKRVLDKPTLFTRGPAEVFTCCPTIYQWLLDHPDQAVLVWRRLGAKCMDIHDQGGGVFAWSDGQGSEVRWWTIHRSAAKRIWYAEGNVRVAGVLPMVPVRGVVVLHHAPAQNPEGRTVMRHQADLFLHTDSKTAALVTRLMGPSAPRMAEQSAGQMEMFFSALAWYLDQYPRKAEQVLLGILPTNAAEWKVLHQRALAPPRAATPPASPKTGL